MESKGLQGDERGLAVLGRRRDVQLSTSRRSASRPSRQAASTPRYRDVDVAELTDFYRFAGVRFGGRATGRNLLEWPMGRFTEHRGNGEVTVTPPGSVDMMGPSLDAVRAADPTTRVTTGVRSFRCRSRRTFRLAARFVHVRTVDCRLHRWPLRDGEDLGVVRGATAWGDESNVRFHVTSADWQESDQVLAGILTDFGSKTGAVAFGGRGEFDGALTGPFRSPRVEGLFSGEDMRAWDTLWGDGSAHIVIENSYVTVKDGLIRKGDSENPRRRALLAGVSAQGRRRGDRRALPRDGPRSRQPASCVRARRLAGVRPVERRVPSHRQLRNASRLRRDDD
ncbi:MAG: hypothetical protein QM736_14460 [Vicinamibacterales bacterium]